MVAHDPLDLQNTRRVKTVQASEPNVKTLSDCQHSAEGPDDVQVKYLRVKVHLYTVEAI